MDKEARPGIVLDMTSLPRPRTLFLVDDHPVVGAGFELAALKSPEFAWLGSAPSLPAASARLDDLSPEILILDLVIDKEIGVAGPCCANRLTDGFPLSPFEVSRRAG
jgi:hypothetical protein